MSEDDVYEDFWRAKWKNGHTHFHRNHVHPMLKASLQELVNGRDISELTIFLPLCGKSLDLAFLLRMGFKQVVGTEFSQEACIKTELCE